ncbi:MAG: hypothetical protein GYA14_03190 [Ignavibacteria bacterium]|nr:hypothetical protein [Ignavibacteria bacterium]
MYAKIENGEVKYLVNIKTEEDLIEVEGNIKYPVYDSNTNTIKEGFNETLQKFIKNKITTEQFLLHIQEITLNCYKRLFAKTDEYVVMREKRKLLEIWTELDEAEFQQKMQEYNDLVLEYKQRKQYVLSIASNKEELINYYTNELLQRLNELNN